MERPVALNCHTRFVGALRHASSVLHPRSSDASTSARSEAFPSAPNSLKGFRGNPHRQFASSWSQNGRKNFLIPVWATNNGDSTESDTAEAALPQFHTIPEALEDIAAGKFVVVLDDEDRENEGDLIIAGDKITTESMAFMVEYTSGVICIAMEGEDLDRLELPLMVDSLDNKEAMRTAFTVTVDLAEGITTGISAEDRSRTIKRLSDPRSFASDFRRPGHIFPLRYQSGGTVVRAGHTEAAVDLSRLAGCHPAGVLCEIVNKEDGSMARTPQLLEFAKRYGLKCITIADLIKYRLKHDTIVEKTGTMDVKTEFGKFEACSYKSTFDGSEYIAFVAGDVKNGESVPVHIHSADYLNDALSSELASAMRWVERQDRGVVIYAVGNASKSQSVLEGLQQLGEKMEGHTKKCETPEHHAVSVQILHDIGVKSIFLLSNVPGVSTEMENLGMQVQGSKVVSKFQVLEDLTGPAAAYLNGHGALHSKLA
ncbi:hypothetical protein BSKO_02335 [Bryopsis sp. KO-2023]|nr:hypothetical protein BSKO_02335 [Bryopsis sp. KO-2023]